MLGSLHDAEDALQEALVRAWRGLGRFEGRSSLRSWLYTVATNSCLRMLEQRSARVLPIDYGPAADPHGRLAARISEPLWLEPYPDAELAVEEREGVELAFVAALQHLPASQRAVLILREVLGYSAAEVGAMLELSPAAVDSAMQRARRTIDARLPDRSQQAVLRAADDAALEALVARFCGAWEAADVDALVALLTEDATITMPPIPTWFAGRDAVAAFLRDSPLAHARRWRVLPTSANGQLATAHYLWDGERFMAHHVCVLTLHGERIAGLAAFLEERAFPRFGLPAAVA
jgi:RNA polymerase sigma-70 factor (ECF subfamily)